MTDATKARALAHYVPMAAAAKRGPQHQIDIYLTDKIVGVPYRGVEWDVAIDIEPADEEHPNAIHRIFAVKLNKVWFTADWAGSNGPLIQALQRQYDAMPDNNDADEDRITAAMLEARQ